MIDLSNKLAWNSETRNEFWRIGLEFMACCFFGNCFASFYLNISDTDGWVWALRHGPIHNSSQTGLICLGLWLCLTGTVITQMFGLAVSNESESAAESIWKRFLAFVFFFFFGFIALDRKLASRGDMKWDEGYKVCHSLSIVGHNLPKQLWCKWGVWMPNWNAVWQACAVKIQPFAQRCFSVSVLNWYPGSRILLLEICFCVIKCDCKLIYLKILLGIAHVIFLPPFVIASIRWCDTCVIETRVSLKILCIFARIQPMFSAIVFI